MGRIKFDVNGQTFAIQKEIILKGPESYLKKLCMANSGDSHVIDRPPEVFSAVIAFYQTGELHIPVTYCPGAFLRELKFWGINQNTLTKCCYFKLQRFLKKQENLNAFQNRMQRHGRKLKSYGQGSLDRNDNKEGNYFWLARPRSKLWAIVDHREKSKVSTIYFSISMLMVLMSIFCLAFSTVPRLKRDMTNCEKLEYMIASDMENIKYVRDLLNSHCDETLIPENGDGDTFVTEVEHDDESIMLSLEIYDDNIDTLDDNDGGDGNSGGDQDSFSTNTHPLRTENTSGWPISMTHSTILTTPESDTSTEKPEILFDRNEKTTEENLIEGGPSDYPESSKNTTKQLTFSNTPISDGGIPTKGDFYIPKVIRIKIPNLRLPLRAFEVIEGIGIIYFSLDLILRLMSCSSILEYFSSIINAMDVLALLGSFAIVTESLFVGKNIMKWIKMIQLLQMLRSFRLFRMVENFTISKVLAYSLVKNRKDVLVMVVYLLAGISIFSTAMYIFEDNETVESIPDAMYWAIITMTTVGYGDLAPKSTMGRLAGGLCAVAGVMVFALAVPLVVNYFVTMYTYAELYEDSGKQSVGRSHPDGKQGESSGLSKTNKEEMIELKVQ